MESPAVTESKDAICDRILAAYENHDGYLNDADLIKAAGIPRADYLKILDYLLEDTHELYEVYLDEDNQPEIVFGRTAPMKSAAKE